MAVRNEKKQKVIITELLQNTIKNLRKEYNMRGDDLSRLLDKGASYISQVENGKIKEIEFDLLVNIFQRIVNLSDMSFNNYMMNYMNNLLQNITKESLAKENWIHLFIMQEFQHPITDNIIAIIDKNLNDYNCSPKDLIDKIEYNCNRGFRHEHKYEPNKLYVNVNSSSLKYDNTDYSLYLDIEYRFPPDFVTKILNKEILTISYINLYGIMLNVFLLKNDDDMHGAIVTTEKFLSDNSFFTSMELYDKFHSEQNDNPEISDNNLFSHYDDLVVNYKKKFDRLKNDVLKEIDYALDQYYEHGIEANNLYKMEEMLKNMNTNTTYADLGLIMAILSSPIYEIHISDRNDFWESYKEIINRFIDRKYK